MLHVVKISELFKDFGSLHTFILPNYVKRIKSISVLLNDLHLLTPILNNAGVKELATFSVILNNDCDYTIIDRVLKIVDDANKTGYYNLDKFSFHNLKNIVSNDINNNALHKFILKSDKDLFDKLTTDEAHFLREQQTLNLYFDYE